MPIFQPLLKLENNKKGLKRAGDRGSDHQQEAKLLKTMQLILFENAMTGELLTLKSKFIEQLREKISV